MRYGTVLWFHDDAEEAVDFYASVMPDLEITHTMPNRAANPGPATPVLLVGFTLGGQTYTALNGGDAHTLTPAVSIEVRTDTQEESDRIYEALLAGGSETACGWLEDRFGLSWQVSPQELLDLVSDPDPKVAEAATRAMQQQKRIDLGPIREAVEAARG